MNKDYKSNDPQTILTQAIDQMKMELGDKFDPEKINLAELERRTGISRSRLRRYKKDGFIIKPHGRTGPAESYQMDWRFVEACRMDGSSYRCACFAMICHHCGERYVEFFPNAKQENLFIGMIHAFYLMGIPKYVLTDNMKSVVISRDQKKPPEGNHPG